MRATGYGTRGQRVAKTVAAVTTHYIYDLGGNLIAEAEGGTGAASAEYVALEGKPLAFIATGAVYWVHGDHLGTPQMLTDASGAAVWDAAYRPFGEATVTGALTFNLRFPGQYADAETGLHYNYFRDYDASTGRYIQSDPIGLQGGWNTYEYASSNPIGYVDILGLNPNLYGFDTAKAQKLQNAIRQALQILANCFNNNSNCPIKDPYEMVDLGNTMWNADYEYETGRNPASSAFWRNLCGYTNWNPLPRKYYSYNTIHLTNAAFNSAGCCPGNPANALASTVAHEAYHLLDSTEGQSSNLDTTCFGC